MTRSTHTTTKPSSPTDTETGPVQEPFYMYISLTQVVDVKEIEERKKCEKVCTDKEKQI